MDLELERSPTLELHDVSDEAKVVSAVTTLENDELEISDVEDETDRINKLKELKQSETNEEMSNTVPTQSALKFDRMVSLSGEASSGGRIDPPTRSITRTNTAPGALSESHVSSRVLIDEKESMGLKPSEEQSQRPPLTSTKSEVFANKQEQGNGKKKFQGIFRRGRSERFSFSEDQGPEQEDRPAGILSSFFFKSGRGSAVFDAEEEKVSQIKRQESDDDNISLHSLKDTDLERGPSMHSLPLGPKVIVHADSKDDDEKERISSNIEANLAQRIAGESLLGDLLQRQGRPSERNDAVKLLGRTSFTHIPQHVFSVDPVIDDILVQERECLKKMFQAETAFSNLCKMILYSFIGYECLMVDIARAKSSELKASSIYCISTIVEKLAGGSQNVRIVDLSEEKQEETCLQLLPSCSVLVAHNLHKAPAALSLDLLEAFRLKTVSVHSGRKADLRKDFFIVCTVDSSDEQGSSGSPILPLHLLRHVMSCSRPSSNDLRQAVVLASHIKSFDGWKPEILSSFREKLPSTQFSHSHSNGDCVFVDQSIRRYMRDIVVALRQHSKIAVGPSRQESSHLTKLSQISSLVNGKLYVRPEDVDDAVVHVIGHRVVLQKQGRTYYDLVESTKLVYHIVHRMLRPPI
jgi:MoxR-like ATPase